MIEGDEEDCFKVEGMLKQLTPTPTSSFWTFNLLGQWQSFY